MSRLSIFPEPGERVGEETPVPQRICSDPESIQRELRTRGVDFEQWPTCRRLRRGAEQEEILGAYADDIRRIQAAEGQKTNKDLGVDGSIEQCRACSYYSVYTPFNGAPCIKHH